MMTMAGKFYAFANWEEHRAYLQFINLTERLLSSKGPGAAETVSVLIEKMMKTRPELVSRALEAYERRRKGDEENLRLLRTLFSRFDDLPAEKRGYSCSKGMRELLRRSQEEVNRKLMDLYRIEYNGGPADGNFGESAKDFRIRIRRGEPESKRYYAS